MKPHRTCWILSLLSWGLAAAPAPAQPELPAPTATAPAALAQRQRDVRDQLQQLESRLATLARLLAETEPDQAERLRAALACAGEKQLKRRLERLAELLEAGALGEAEQAQKSMLADLKEMLRRLTDTSTELDRKRAARQRLETFKRTLRLLIDRQLDAHYRTQATATEPLERAALRPLEDTQRQLAERAARLEAELRAPREDAPERAARSHVGRAREHMQTAADRLGELEPEAALAAQAAALEQLQRGLDAIDDVLRQVRREELEETLVALETRFKRMLRDERRVAQDVAALADREPDERPGPDQRSVEAAAQMQHAVAAQCDAVVRILVSEGTTVVLPELAGQLAGDMAATARRLDEGDISPPTRDLLDHIVAGLAEIVAAIELRRQQDLQMLLQPPGDGPAGTVQALLPVSAELKLLRSAQVRINDRTMKLAETGGVPSPPTRAAALHRLSEQQRRLIELVRRMHERK